MASPNCTGDDNQRSETDSGQKPTELPENCVSSPFTPGRVHWLSTFTLNWFQSINFLQGQLGLGGLGWRLAGPVQLSVCCGSPTICRLHLQTAVVSCPRIQLAPSRRKQLPTMKLLLAQLMTAALALLVMGRPVQPGALVRHRDPSESSILQAVGVVTRQCQLGYLYGLNKLVKPTSLIIL